MCLHGGWINVLSLQVSKVVLQCWAAGNRPQDGGPQLCSFWVFHRREHGAWQGSALAGRILADLLSLGGTRCCRVVGDIRGSSCDLEAFFVSIFQARSVIRDPPASSLAVVQLFCYRLLGSGKIPKFMYNRKHPWLAIWTTSVKQFGTKITLIIAECRERFWITAAVFSVLVWTAAVACWYCLDHTFPKFCFGCYQWLLSVWQPFGRSVCCSR